MATRVLGLTLLLFLSAISFNNCGPFKAMGLKSSGSSVDTSLVDENGNPIPEATLSVRVVERTSQVGVPGVLISVASVTSGVRIYNRIAASSSGEQVFGPMDINRYLVIAERDGFESSQQVVDLSTTTSIKIDLTRVATPPVYRDCTGARHNEIKISRQPFRVQVACAQPLAGTRDEVGYVEIRESCFNGTLTEIQRDRVVTGYENLQCRSTSCGNLQNGQTTVQTSTEERREACVAPLAGDIVRTFLISQTYRCNSGTLQAEGSPTESLESTDNQCVDTTPYYRLKLRVPTGNGAVSASGQTVVGNYFIEIPRIRSGTVIPLTIQPAAGFELERFGLDGACGANVRVDHDIDCDIYFRRVPVTTCGSYANGQEWPVSRIENRSEACDAPLSGTREVEYTITDRYRCNSGTTQYIPGSTTEVRGSIVDSSGCYDATPNYTMGVQVLTGGGYVVVDGMPISIGSIRYFPNIRSGTVKNIQVYPADGWELDRFEWDGACGTSVRVDHNINCGVSFRQLPAQPTYEDCVIETEQASIDYPYFTYTHRRQVETGDFPACQEKVNEVAREHCAQEPNGGFHYRHWLQTQPGRVGSGTINCN